MKKYIGLLSFYILVSCSAKKAAIAETVANDKLTSDKIIDNHYKKDQIGCFVLNLSTKTSKKA